MQARCWSRYTEMQDFEFTFEKGGLHLLTTHCCRGPS